MASARTRDIVGVIVGTSGDGKSHNLRYLVDTTVHDPEHIPIYIKSSGRFDGTTKEMEVYTLKKMGGRGVRLFDLQGIGDKTRRSSSIVGELLAEFSANDLNFVIVTFKVSGIGGATPLGHQVAEMLIQKGIVKHDKGAHQQIILVGTHKDKAEEWQIEAFERTAVPEFYKKMGANIEVPASQDDPAPDLTGLPWCYTWASETATDKYKTVLKLDVSELVTRITNLPYYALRMHEITPDDYMDCMSVIAALMDVEDPGGAEGQTGEERVRRWVEDKKEAEAEAKRLNEVIRTAMQGRLAIEEQQTKKLPQARANLERLLEDHFDALGEGQEAVVRGELKKIEEKEAFYNKWQPRGGDRRNALRNLALEKGVKILGKGYARCCPPHGYLEDIMWAIMLKEWGLIDEKWCKWDTAKAAAFQAAEATASKRQKRREARSSRSSRSSRSGAQ